MRINGHDYRSVWFEHGRLKMIDQNKLPLDFAVREYSSYLEVAEAIRDMTVRGAPAIGAAGAYAMALAALSAPDEKFRAYLRSAHQELISTRPTAVDLSIGVNHVYESTLKFIPDLPHARQVSVLAANEYANKSAEDCLELGVIGAALIPEGARILTHCNAGALATVDHGTALSVIRQAHKQGKNIFVYVDETRPRFQGARLTAFELEQEEFRMPSSLIRRRVLLWKTRSTSITGADRVCPMVISPIRSVPTRKPCWQKCMKCRSILPRHTVLSILTVPGRYMSLAEIRDEDEIKRINGSYLANPGSSLNLI